VHPCYNGFGWGDALSHVFHFRRLSISVFVRNYRRDDLAKLTNLIAEAKEDGIVNELRSGEQVRHWLEHPSSYPESDLFLAEVDGELIGYAVVHSELEVGWVILGGAVHPDCQRQGVGAKLMEVALAYSETLQVGRIRLPISSTATEVRRFAQKYGFAPVRYYWEMRLDSVSTIGVLDPPPGCQLRCFACGDAPRLAAIQNRAFARSWGFRPNTVEEIDYQVKASWCRPEGILFILEKGEVVGYCWTTIDEERIGSTGDAAGRIGMTGISPCSRLRGLGRVVLTAGIAYLREQGMQAVELSIDRRNQKARKLYESLGFCRKAITVWYQKKLPAA